MSVELHGAFLEAPSRQLTYMNVVGNGKAQIARTQSNIAETRPGMKHLKHMRKNAIEFTGTSD